MEIKPEVLDELLKGIKTQEDLAGPNGLLKAITKALVERMLEGELTHHLGYEKNDPAGYGSGNSRNGKTRKTLRSEQGEMEVAVPRDRQGSFEPQLVRKHQTRWNGLDDKIIALYARGMTVRDIQAQLHEMYGVDVSPGLISEVTDAVLDCVPRAAPSTVPPVRLPLSLPPMSALPARATPRRSGRLNVIEPSPVP